MSKLRNLAAACLAFAGLALPAVAEALICDTLGAAASQFDVVAADKVDARPRRPYAGYYGAYCATWGMATDSMATCSGSARFFGASLEQCTATRAKGKAMSFKDGGQECGQGAYVWQVYTGGGVAKFSGAIDFTTDYAVDTTGTHPSIGACTGAIAQMRAASAAFAAMTPVKTFGRIRIKRGEEYVLDAKGGGVINIDEISMEAVPVSDYNGYRVGTCSYNADVLGRAVLTIDSNPTDEVVLNVRSLEIGGCAEIFINSPVLVNLPGPGRKIRIGIAAFSSSNFPPDILAPERTVAVTGGRTEEITPFSGVYARKLVTLGYVYNVPPLCKTCGNGTLDPGEGCEDDGDCTPGAGLYCDFACSGCGSTYCGDGIRVGTETCDGAEGCDPGSGIYCNDTCTRCTDSRCGDGIRAGSETCDGTAGCTAPEVCNRSCSACTTCGNGVVDGSETCDGTLGCSAGTYCRSDCSGCFTRCGDGIIAASEVCDGGAGCAAGSFCNSSCSACIARCGDGIIAGSEACDRTAGCAAGTYCNGSCSACVPRCGDGIIAGSEACDGSAGCDPAAGTSCNCSCSACVTAPGSQVCLPNQVSSYSGMVRGYWFTAPVNFTIVGMRVPTDASTAAQSIQVMRMNAPVPTYPDTTTDYTTLGYWYGVNGTDIISCNIPVQSGDTIGVLGYRGQMNSYTSRDSGPYYSFIAGQEVILTRFGYQGNIDAGVPAGGVFQVSGSLSRVELYYTTDTSSNDLSR